MSSLLLKVMDIFVILKDNIIESELELTTNFLRS